MPEQQAAHARRDFGQEECEIGVGEGLRGEVGGFGEEFGNCVAGLDLRSQKSVETPSLPELSREREREEKAG